MWVFIGSNLIAYFKASSCPCSSNSATLRGDGALPFNAGLKISRSDTLIRGLSHWAYYDSPMKLLIALHSPPYKWRGLGKQMEELGPILGDLGVMVNVIWKPSKNGGIHLLKIQKAWKIAEIRQFPILDFRGTFKETRVSVEYCRVL